MTGRTAGVHNVFGRNLQTVMCISGDRDAAMVYRPGKRGPQSSHTFLQLLKILSQSAWITAFYFLKSANYLLQMDSMGHFCFLLQHF